MGKATELISKIRESFNELTFHKFTDAELDAEIKSIVASLSEEEIESEVLEDIEGEVSEAVSTFPKAKMIKSMQALLKKIEKGLEPLRKKASDLRWEIDRNTKKKGDKPLPASANKRRLSKLKQLKDSRKKVQADIDKQLSIKDRARKQLDKLNAERKEYNKKRKQDAKKK